MQTSSRRRSGIGDVELSCHDLTCRQIKEGNEDERGLEPGELRTRYGHLLEDILMDTVKQSEDGRDLCSFVARKSKAQI